MLKRKKEIKTGQKIAFKVINGLPEYIVRVRKTKDQPDQPVPKTSFEQELEDFIARPSVIEVLNITYNCEPDGATITAIIEYITYDFEVDDRYLDMPVMPEERASGLLEED